MTQRSVCCSTLMQRTCWLIALGCKKTTIERCCYMSCLVCAVVHVVLAAHSSVAPYHEPSAVTKAAVPLVALSWSRRYQQGLTVLQESRVFWDFLHAYSHQQHCLIGWDDDIRCEGCCSAAFGCSRLQHGVQFFNGCCCTVCQPMTKCP